MKVKETALYPNLKPKSNSKPPVWKCLSLPLFPPLSQWLFKATASKAAAKFNKTLGQPWDVTDHFPPPHCAEKDDTL